MNSIKQTERIIIHRICGQEVSNETDFAAIEEPLEIQLALGTECKPISITMRTPGSDEALGIGFLFTEGIIHHSSDVTSATHIQFPLGAGTDPNRLLIRLSEGVMPDLSSLNRHFYTSSSCGVCGKASIEAVRTTGSIQTASQTAGLSVAVSILGQLPENLRKAQDVFDQTGGLHAAAWFDLNGNLRMVQEDVGRHNALDKLIGTALIKGELPLSNGILLLSGRASFELIQKAAMAGIKIVAAVGAPSSLAISLAQEFDITLIGFLRENRMNVYHKEERINTDL